MNTVAVTAANRPRRKITLTRIFRYPFPDWFLVIETSVRMRPNACQVCKLPHRRDRGGAWDGAWDGPPSRRYDRAFPACARCHERRPGPVGDPVFDPEGSILETARQTSAARVRADGQSGSAGMRRDVRLTIAAFRVA